MYEYRIESLSFTFSLSLQLVLISLLSSSTINNGYMALTIVVVFNTVTHQNDKETYKKT